ncbi:hypothetical protein BsWGS_11365 [Bradybaena similaris]
MTLRPLTHEETSTFFDKLSKYIRDNIKLLIDRPDGAYCFRLHKDLVYYMCEELQKISSSATHDSLLSIGSCFGKFTKSGKFHLHVTALHNLAPSAKHKVVEIECQAAILVWSPCDEIRCWMYNGRAEQYLVVIVYNMNDQHLGFGVSEKTHSSIRKL